MISLRLLLSTDHNPVLGITISVRTLSTAHRISDGQWPQASGEHHHHQDRLIPRAQLRRNTQTEAYGAEGRDRFKQKC